MHTCTQFFRTPTQIIGNYTLVQTSLQFKGKFQMNIQARFGIR